MQNFVLVFFFRTKLWGADLSLILLNPFFLLENHGEMTLNFVYLQTGGGYSGKKLRRTANKSEYGGERSSLVGNMLGGKGV